MSFNTTEQLSVLLTGQTITGIEVFNVHDDFYAFDPQTFVVDGGVELHLGDERFSLGWNYEMELFDCVMKPLSSLLGKLDSYPLQGHAEQLKTELLGKKIASVATKWNFYQDFDENFDPLPDKKYIAEEVLLTFEDETQLQLATIQFTLENGVIHQPIYDSLATLLVTTNVLEDIKLLG